VTALAFETGFVTHRGCVRALNEDSVLAMPEMGLWAVADGLGGHERGDVASRTIVDRLATLTLRASASEFLRAFEDEILAVHAELRALARSSGAAMIGATLVALIVHSAHFACLWCGDSRAYLRRNGSFAQLSHDHSEVQELIDRGILSEEEARSWPRRNVITRALGAESVELELVDGPACPGDRFLLCSDGLVVHVANAEIAALIERLTPQAACDELLRLTLERGASDNVSIVVVDCVPEPTRPN
jgi:protein phosphatase